MKRTKMFSTAIALAALLALSVALTAQHSLSSAQGPEPVGSVPAAELIGNAFTYQGELNKDGAPVNATCEMVFSLYDDAAAGDLVGAPLTLTVAVADGLFTVALDFESYAFIGEARWLEVAVQCPGDGDFNTLTPRQALTAAPYALGLRPGAMILGERGGGHLFTAYNLSADPGSVGLGGITASTDGFGVYGAANASSGTTYGVYAESASTGGRGLYSSATSTSGYTFGIYALAASSSGVAVYGRAHSTEDSETYGVYGRSDSLQGMGVRGYASATSGNTYGVYSWVNSPDGRGIYGLAPTYGVYGQSSGTWGDTYGVYGEASSTLGGVGVYGTSPHYGVYGDGSVGVYGGSGSTVGHGVHAYVGSTSGDTRAVYAQARSPDGWAGYFMTSYGNGVHITSNSGKVGLEVAGGSKNAVVRTADGSRLLYSEESTAVWFSDYGFGQLQDGVTVIPIDPIFAQTVNLDEPYHVFVQVYGDAEVYVSKRTSIQFEVHLREGDPDVEFSYRIVAARLGFEGQRLERAPWADKDPNLYPELLDSPGGEP